MAEKKMAIIATKGTLDWAYPPFILASTAAALGFEVQIFFTFYGLQLLRKNLKLKISSLGNPGMPMKMGPVTVPMPVLLQALPGMQSMMTVMMKSRMKSKGIASVEELRSLCIEADVKLIGCQMTVDLFDFGPSEFIDGVEFAGASMFLGFAGDADISLYI
ncbi:MAG: peroxiredoxin family protein [Gammaproteobacteria bacterium]|nr:peroxiredoxin family protein [Gammaproteobacteria bacterium]